MRPLHTSVLVVFTIAGCVSQAQPTPEYGESYVAGQSTGPADDSYAWSGPPGGAIDPGFGYNDPSLAGSPSEPSAEGGVYDASSPVDGGDPTGGAAEDPNAASGAPGVWTGATADVTDAEIDVTLDAYGEWVEDPDYGRVWRPYTTVVGAEFTPYESCGSWVFTDYGWTFQSCDAWTWGWLPFHFGRWVYLDNSWCWSRDYTWGPGWVEWRHGGGYVGWRPMRPTRQIRDHRDRYTGPRIRDHRRGKHDEWRFHTSEELGRGRIRSARSVSEVEGLRATTAVAQPPVRGDFRGRASTVMAGRMRDHQRFDTRTRGSFGQSTRGYEPARPSIGTTQPPTRGPRGAIGTRGYNPTYNPSVVSPDRDRPTWNRSSTWTGAPGTRGQPTNPPPSRSDTRPTRDYAPATGSFSGPSRSDTRPTRDYAPATGTFSGPSRGYPPPTRGYSPPSRNPSPPSRSYTRPTRDYAPATGSFSGPSRGYSPPSRSSSPPSRGYSPPSRSSSPPSRGYSPPSRSSSPPSRSYSAPSRSSSSSSSPSRSSSSGSSRSSSSSGGSRGGRHR